MNKQLFAIACCMLFTSLSFGQVRLGPEVGLNYGSISREIENFSTVNTKRPGFRAGVVADFPVTKNVSIQSGVFYATQSTVTTTKVSILNTLNYEAEQTLKVNYLKVPLNVVYKSGDNDKGRLFVGAGPYVGFVMGGSSEVDVIQNPLSGLGGLLGGAGGLGSLLGGLGGNTNPLLGQLGGLTSAVPTTQEGTEDIKTGTDSADHVKPLDIGMNVQIGYELPSGFIFRGQYSFGITNTAPLDVNRQYNWNTSLSIAYIIGLNKKGNKED